MLVIRYLPPSTSALGGEQVWRKAVEQHCSSLLAKKLAIMIFFFFFFVFSPLFQSSHFPALWGTASRWDLILQNPEKCFLAILQHLNAVWIVFGLAKKKKPFSGSLLLWQDKSPFVSMLLQSCWSLPFLKITFILPGSSAVCHPCWQWKPSLRKTHDYFTALDEKGLKLFLKTCSLVVMSNGVELFRWGLDWQGSH